MAKKSNMLDKLSKRVKPSALRDKIKTLVKAMLSLDYPPHTLALSSAVGTFIGVLPFYGFQTLMAIGAAKLFRLPPLPVLACIHVTNPLTFPLVYGGALKLGVVLLNVEINIDLDGLSLVTLVEIGKEILLPLLFGCFIVGVVMAVLTYAIVYCIAKGRDTYNATSFASADSSSNADAKALNTAKIGTVDVDAVNIDCCELGADGVDRARQADSAVDDPSLSNVSKEDKS